MELGLHEIARVAYVAEQAAEAQLSGTVGVEWEALTAAQQEPFKALASGYVSSGAKSKGGADIVTAVGSTTPLKAQAVFQAVVYALMMGK